MQLLSLLCRVSGAMNLAVGFNPRCRGIFFHVASATIEFSRRSRDAGNIHRPSRGLKPTAKFMAPLTRQEELGSYLRILKSGLTNDLPLSHPRQTRLGRDG